MKNLLILALLYFPSLSLADWVLVPERSELSYLSAKVTTAGPKTIFEENRFGSLQGRLDEAGHAQLTIDLDSVQTKVPIRDERVRAFVFQTAVHPQGTVITTVDMQALAGLSPGDYLAMEVVAKVTLNGISRDLPASIVVTRLNQNGLLVQTVKPILLDALDYNMEEGFLKLRELVQLLHIPTTIPVSFRLVYQPA